MNLIIKLLVYLKWMKINRRHIKNWHFNKNEAMLIFTLKKGWYKERQLAAEILGQMRSQKAIRSLSKSCQDKYREVAETAMDALKKFPQTEQIQKVVKKAELYWQLQATKKKRRHRYLKEITYSDINVANKSEKMQQLERVRQQLKSSIRMH